MTMRRLSFGLVLLLAVLRCYPALGAERIVGAFGKKLGDKFDPNSAIRVAKATDGTPMFEFSTKVGFRSFRTYYVLVTPTTNRIYAIVAQGSVENSGAARKERAVVMEVLRRKYGAKNPSSGAVAPKPNAEAPASTDPDTAAWNESIEQLKDAIDDTERIVQGRREVGTAVDGFPPSLRIQYIDRDLEKLAETERIAEEVRTVDQSGL